ncbi:MAG: hypothetical protein QW331_02440 [Candidatus Woesearchaeota archaeon]
MYLIGAFAYPYLEDDDPWAHALSVKYVSIKKTVYEPVVGKHYLIYLDARPPAFDGILGILHQTSPSINWTLKFFNSLFISLGILFFFYFSKRFFSSSKKALLATFFLTMFPTYLTHFIWSQGLALTLIIVGLYVLFEESKTTKYLIFSGIITSAVFVTQETKAIKFVILIFLLFLAKSISFKKVEWKTMFVLMVALVISFALWWGPMLIKYGPSKIFSEGIRQGEVRDQPPPVHPSIEGIKRYGILGSATRQHGQYTFNDIFFAKGQNTINVPIGVGVVLSILLVLALVYFVLSYKKLINDPNKLALIFWSVFVFFGVHGGTRWWAPFALYTFRFWLFFALVGSLLAVYGTYLLLSLGKKANVPPIMIIILIFFGVWFTSGQQKFELNTAQWGPGGGWMSFEELDGYLWLRSLPINTKIFATNEEGTYRLIGLDMYSCGWCQNEIEFREKINSKDVSEISNWLKRNEYEYIIFDQRTFSEKGNQTTVKIQEIASSDLFTLANQNPATIIFKVK